MACSPDPNGSNSDDTRLVVTGWQTVNKKPKSTKVVSTVREDTSSANEEDTKDLNDVELATLVSPEEIEENQSRLKVVIETYNEDDIVDCTHEGDVVAEILSKGEEVGLFRVLFEDGHTAEVSETVPAHFWPSMPFTLLIAHPFTTSHASLSSPPTIYAIVVLPITSDFLQALIASATKT